MYSLCKIMNGNSHEWMRLCKGIDGKPTTYEINLLIDDDAYDYKLKIMGMFRTPIGLVWH